MLAGRSLSSKLADSVETHRTANEDDVEMEPTPLAASESQQSTILSYMNLAKITEKQKNKIELLMFEMFICCALPWALLNSESFIEFVLALAPNFHIPDRSVFFPKHLAQETANWNQNF